MAITCVGGAESVRGVRIRGMVREVAEHAEVGKATATAATRPRRTWWR